MAKITISDIKKALPNMDQPGLINSFLELTRIIFFFKLDSFEIIMKLVEAKISFTNY